MNDRWKSRPSPRALRVTKPYDPNEVIQSLWIGDSLSTMEQLCVNSFLKNGHVFHLYLYDKCEGVPEGAVIKDANEIILERSIKGDFQKSNPSFFSDQFRYKLLQEKERWWVDMDTICLKHFDFPEDYVFASEVSIDGKGMMVDNGILKAPKYSELLSQARVRTTNSTFGPAMMTDLTRDLDLRGYVKGPWAFTPVMPWLIPDIFIKNIPIENRPDTKKSFAIHLWNSSWEKTPKNGTYDSNSWYEELKRKYM